MSSRVYEAVVGLAARMNKKEHVPHSCMKKLMRCSSRNNNNLIFIFIIIYFRLNFLLRLLLVRLWKI